MGLKECMNCGNSFSENEDNFRLYKYPDRIEYCNMCITCEKDKQRELSKKRYDQLRSVGHDLSAKDWEDCLAYFNYKDAYTGMPLINVTMDHIIPISENGSTTRENIIPCELEINSSKNNRHMIGWFKSQDFYSDERLKKILLWMGVYSKYLYIPVEQREYIDIEKSKSIYHYTITLPNGYRKKLYYSNNGNLKKRTLVLKKAIIDEWEDYFNNCWLYSGKTELFKFNHEDKVRDTLDRSAGFLFAKDKTNKYKILEKVDIDKIYENEVPLSCTASNIQDAIYGIDEDDENYSYDSGNFMTIEHRKGNKKQKVKHWKSSKSCRMNIVYNNTIDKSKPYVSKWCAVDTENIFIFQDKKHKISEDVSQYTIRTKKPRYDDYKSDYQMDQILVYEQEGELFFFDQDIQQLEDNKITVLI